MSGSWVTVLTWLISDFMDTMWWCPYKTVSFLQIIHNRNVEKLWDVCCKFKLLFTLWDSCCNIFYIHRAGRYLLGYLYGWTSGHDDPRVCHLGSPVPHGLMKSRIYLFQIWHMIFIRVSTVWKSLNRFANRGKPNRIRLPDLGSWQEFDSAWHHRMTRNEDSGNCVKRIYITI